MTVILQYDLTIYRTRVTSIFENLLFPRLTSDAPEHGKLSERFPCLGPQTRYFTYLLMVAFLKRLEGAEVMVENLSELLFDGMLKYPGHTLSSYILANAIRLLYSTRMAMEL